MFPPQMMPPGMPGMMPPNPMGGMMGGPGMPMPAPQPMTLPPGMPRPGAGMDPMAAMLGGLGLMPPMPSPNPSGVSGPNGLPVGGSLPADVTPQDMGGSALMRALIQSESPDPYTQPPGVQPLAGMGTSDPQGGLGDIMNLLALAQMGVAGDPTAGGPMGFPGMV